MLPDWFPGWTYKGNDVVNAQPNDDGFSGQDCVELRQRFSSYSTQHGKNLEINSISVKGSFVPVTSNEKFYWNDRHCETKNFYLCEKATHQSKLDLFFPDIRYIVTLTNVPPIFLIRPGPLHKKVTGIFFP